MPEIKFKVGDIVEHVLSKDYVMIIKEGRTKDQFLCRLKDFREVWLYTFEIKPRK